MSSQNLDGLYFESWMSVELGNGRKKVGFCDIVLGSQQILHLCRISRFVNQGVAGKIALRIIFRLVSGYEIGQVFETDFN